MASQPKKQAPQKNQGPLTGIRVLDIANVVAGPVCAQILGDFGAEVIKIEHPDGGDGMRRQGVRKKGVPLWFSVVGRNKRSVSMYLGDPEVGEIFLELVKTADVVVENFRPGTLEKWNLGWDRLSAANPRLILARLSGFGQTGPYATRPAFGTLIESMTGFAHLTGEPDGPPTLPPLALADYMAGITGAGAVAMALYHRDARGGAGQVIDLSIFEPLMSTMGAQIVRYDQLGVVESRTGNRSVNTAPRNTYKTKEGHWIGMAASTNMAAARIVAMVGRPEIAKEPWFNTGPGRVEHNDMLDEVVGGWIAERSVAEVMREAEKFEVTCAPVYDMPQLFADKHVQAREMLTAVDDPDLGPVRMPNVLFRMSASPGGIRKGAPRLGDSTDAVLLGELGLDPAKLAKLRERGVVR
ncbi:MAG: CoA transferase [Alphaproteobacteria bacterium]|nr:CoA transferase [Alphaproteobacteria bacterium]